MAVSTGIQLMRQQLDLFGQPPAAGRAVVESETQLACDACGQPGMASGPWDGRNWRFAANHDVEYLHPEPTSPAPPGVTGGEWQWNPLVPGWRLRYSEPPFSHMPRGETVDEHGPKLLPPPGFLLFDRRRLGGRCPHCSAQSTGHWGGPGWGGWADPRVAAAYEAEEAAGRRCYGLTVVDVPGLGAVAPLSHYSRWGAGYCTACGAIWWNDFREPASAHFRPPGIRRNG